MRDRQRMVFLLIVMSAVVLAVGAFSTYTLYITAFRQQQERLAETARNQVRLIEALAGFHDNNQGHAHITPAKVLEQFTDAYLRYESLGDSGEIVLAEREGEEIRFLLRRYDVGDPATGRIPWNSELADPMRQALTGRSGFMVALDYRGKEVLAAYAPVTPFGWGVVAKIDLAEIQAPYVKAGAASGGAVLLAILALGILFIGFSRPAIRRLALSEARTEAILEAAVDAIITIDARGVIHYVNSATARVFGYPPEELLGRNVNMLMPEPYRTEHSGYIDNYIRTGQARIIGVGREVIAQRKDGTVFSADLAVSEMRSDRERMFMGTIRDITDRKRAEDELRESQRALAILMSNLPGMVYRCRNDEDWTMEFVSDGCIELTGHHPTELIANQKVSYAQLIHPDDRAAVVEQVNDAVARQAPFKIVYRIVSQDGRTKWVWEQGYGIYNPDGELLHIEGLITDITDRKNAENELLESQQKLALHVELTPLGVIVWSKDFEVTEWNPSAERIFGYAKHEAIGLSGKKILPAELTAKLMEGTWAQLISNRGPSHMINDNVTKDGRRVLCEWFNTPLVDTEGNVMGVASLVQDITARKEAEAEIVRLNQDLERRVRERTLELETINKELESFTYSVSHDLRAPLRHINAYAQILVEDYSHQLEAESLRYLGTIQTSARKMGALIDDLLTLSRLGRKPVQRRLVDCARLVREVWTDTLADAGDRTIEFNLAPLPPARADASLLRQVWANLLGNALKYSSTREKSVIGVDSHLVDGAQWYRVRDNGVGFDSRYADKLFGVFQRLHREDEFPGTGVGLAIVQRIIHKHGGQIRGSGEVNRGATFEFTLGEA